MEKENSQVKETKQVKKNVPRCKCKLEDGKKCKKKLTLVDLCIVCKCGKSFCPKHRTPEAHKCKISEIIAQKNREVQLDKVLGGGSFKQIEVI